MQPLRPPIIFFPCDNFGNAPYTRSQATFQFTPKYLQESVDENAVIESENSVDPVDEVNSSGSENLSDAAASG